MIRQGMARFQHSIRPVNRIKHVFDSQFGSALGVTTLQQLVFTVDAPVATSPNQVQTGATVNSIFLNVEVNATSSAALANVYLAVFKNPGSNLSLPSPNVVGSSNNKKYAIHQEMVMMQQQTNSNPRTLFKGVIRIPRGYRRCGPNDEITLSILAPGVNVNVCVQCIYKEFR